MHRTPLAILALGVAACSHSHVARDRMTLPASLSRQIDAIGLAALQAGPIAGLSIAVVQGGDVLHVNGYGVTDLERGTPARPETLFNMASVAKILTAAAILTLVDSGRLDLEADLASLLPCFPNQEQAQKITLRQLLNHTSGLNDYAAAAIERWKQTGEPLQPEFVLDYAGDRELDFEPGKSWRYSNTGFYLAGLIIERASGKSWSQYTLETVARPLGLHSVALCDDSEDLRTPGFDVTSAGLVPSRETDEEGVRGDGGLCATALDVARIPWALETSGLLSRDSLAEMLQPTVLTSGISVDYGLGVALGSLGGQPLWGHLGGNEKTYVATLAHYPQSNVTVAVLVNSLFGEVGALQIEASVAQLVLGLGLPLLADHPLTARELAAYSGEYIGDRANRSLTIAVRGDRIVRLKPDGVGPALPLLRQGTDSFGREDWPLDRFLFHRPEDHAAAVSIYYNGFFDGFYLRTAADRPLPHHETIEGER